MYNERLYHKGKTLEQKITHMEEDNRLVYLLKRHFSKILLGVLVLACLGIWSERLLERKKSQSKEDFFVAQQLYDQFQKGHYLAAESLETAEQILKRHPELHPKYDQMLALAFLSQHKGQEALPYAKSMIGHVEAQLPLFYKEFAQTTLLIAEGSDTEAFSAALELDQKLSHNPEYKNLDALNTLRLLFLADKLGDKMQREIFWNKLEKHPAYLAIQGVFHEGNITLSDYFKTK